MKNHALFNSLLEALAAKTSDIHFNRLRHPHSSDGAARFRELSLIAFELMALSMRGHADSFGPGHI